MRMQVRDQDTFIHHAKFSEILEINYYNIYVKRSQIYDEVSKI